MSACTLGRVYAQICLLGCQRICCLRDFSPPWKGRIAIAVQEEEEEEAMEVDALSPYLPPSLPPCQHPRHQKISFLMPSLFFLCCSTIF